MVKISGYSDDLVEIEGDKYLDNEIDSYDKDTLFAFSDGTVLRMTYGEPCGTWRAVVERKGSADYSIDKLIDNDDYYSDLFATEASIDRVWQEDAEHE